MALTRSRSRLTQCSGIDSIELPLEEDVDFDALWSLRPAESGVVQVMGKTVPVPRRHQSYNLPYQFSGVWHAAKPVPPELYSLWAFVNRLGYGSFNQVLVNWYQNGLDYISMHQDNESEIVQGSPVVTVSKGSERVFRIRRKGKDEEQRFPIVEDFPVLDGSILVMWGEFQCELYHEVPKICGKKGLEVGPRISVTFRQMKEEGCERTNKRCKVNGDAFLERIQLKEAASAKDEEAGTDAVNMCASDK